MLAEGLAVTPVLQKTLGAQSEGGGFDPGKVKRYLGIDRKQGRRPLFLFILQFHPNLGVYRPLCHEREDGKARSRPWAILCGSGRLNENSLLPFLPHKPDKEFGGDR
jgi:hypothetical protein